VKCENPKALDLNQGARAGSWLYSVDTLYLSRSGPEIKAICC
jgi:hypothetical protein